MKKGGDNRKPPHGGQVCCLCRYRGRAVCDSDCPFAPYFPPGTEANLNAVLRFCGIKTLTDILHLAPDNHKGAVAATLVEDALRTNPSGGGCPQIISYLVNEIRLSHALINDLYKCYRKATTQAQPMTKSVTAWPPFLTKNNTTAPGAPVQINPQVHHHRPVTPVHQVQQQVLNPASSGGTFNTNNNVAQAINGNLVQANAGQNVQEFQDNNRLDQRRQQNHQAQNDGGSVKDDGPTSASSGSSSESRSGDPKLD